MKGHLNIADLEKYKKADIQKLANELGVSAEGTVKEIAARCAEVEVEIPDGNQLADEEKAAAADKEPTTAGKITVRVIQDYKDLQLKRVVETGEKLEVDKDRAATLTNLKLAVTE